MSALDAKIGSFISEETILKQLKGKTVILVTHGLQYLKHADHIYVMEDGSIAKQGSFEEIKDTELYTKFTQLEEVSFKIQKNSKLNNFLVEQKCRKQGKTRPKGRRKRHRRRKLPRAQHPRHAGYGPLQNDEREQ